LQLQQQQAQEGRPIMLGAALMELGLISRENLDRAIMSQIVDLQTALQASNRQLEERVAERTAALEDAFRKLNEVNQIKANFISNISHELRTPLAQVKGYIALVTDGILGILNQDQNDAMCAATRALDRLETLIEDMIRFATAARGELIVNASVFCISDTITSIVNRSAAKAAKASLTVTTEIPPQPIYVHGDAEKLSWVLIQLLDNAIKFTPAEGKANVRLTADTPHRTVRVEVADTGIGIPVERIPELFQAFHQLDGSSTRKYGGTGLGLALVREIVEAHSGQVNIESELGKGSRFWFELPMATPPAEG
jgi:signal transduction histidine kinase